MAKLGDAMFNKVLNKSGGFVLDQGVIRYILAKEMPDGYSVFTPIDRVKMIFGVDADKLVSKIGLYIYEPIGNKIFVADNVKFIGFNLKTYKVTEKKPIRRVSHGGQTFTVHMLVGVEVL